MLKVYKAIALDESSIKTGSTQPCIMTLADDNGNLKAEYVVKVFRPKNLQQSSNTLKEVFGSILASAFDLKTPGPVLARVDEKIIDLLNKHRSNNLMSGTYFATEYIENALDYSKTTNSRIESWEIENIFAFDVLIRNVDRRTKKPNLFFKDAQAFLIDHELSFSSLDKPFRDMLKEREKYWKFVEIENEDGFERKHLFLGQLREQNKVASVQFDTFAEYLRNLDVDLLDHYNRQLQDLGMITDDYLAIKSYLSEVKSNSGLFIQLLKDLIS